MKSDTYSTKIMPACIICGATYDHMGAICEHCKNTLLQMMAKEESKEYVSKPDLDATYYDAISKAYEYTDAEINERLGI